MAIKAQQKLTFGRLPDISPAQIITHMSDERVAQPLIRTGIPGTSRYDHNKLSY